MASAQSDRATRTPSVPTLADPTTSDSSAADPSSDPSVADLKVSDPSVTDSTASDLPATKIDVNPAAAPSAADPAMDPSTAGVETDRRDRRCTAMTYVPGGTSVAHAGHSVPRIELINNRWRSPS